MANKKKAPLVMYTTPIGESVESAHDAAPLKMTSGDEQMNSRRENTRSRIALVYVCAFLGIIAGSLLIGMIKGYTISDSKEILLGISAVLSGPLGFIIGYYFKASNTE